MAAKPGNTKLNGDYSINIIINNENELRYFYNGVDLQVQIIQGSVLNEIVDVIVTPTSKLLEPIDPDGFKIRKSAGQNIQNDLNAHLKTKQKGFPNGEIFPTKSHDLIGSKYILHVVIDEIKTKKSEDIKKLLENVFLKILTSFEKFEDVNSISLPFIKDVKNDVYSKATLSAIEKYRESKKQRIKWIKIVINEENFKESLKCFREYLKIQPNQQEKNAINYEKPVIQKQQSQQDAKIGKCSLCDREAKLKRILPCDCQYCNKCEKNYAQNNQCECSLQACNFQNEIESINENHTNKQTVERFHRVTSKPYELKYKSTSIDLQIEIYEGYLVEQEVDVIVNAANSALKLGSGVAGAIRSRGGYKVQDECDEYLDKNHLPELQDTHVMHTNSYMSNCNFIIHAVGPNISNYKKNEEMCYKILETTFLNVLLYAEQKLQASSVALPLISSGVYSVPIEICCEKLFFAIQNFIKMKKNEANKYLNCIKIVSINKSVNLDIQTYFEKNLILEGNETFQSNRINPLKSSSEKDIINMDIEKDKKFCYNCEMNQSKSKIVMISQEIQTETINETTMNVFQAAEIGNYNFIKTWLETNQNLINDSGGKWNRTPLFYAVHYGHLDIVELLLKNQCDVNKSDINGFTPLMWAICHQRYNIVNLLLKYNANVNLKNIYNSNAIIYAAKAGKTEIVEQLLQKGANINETNIDGDTAISIAIENNHSDIVEILRQYGTSSLHNFINRFFRY